MRNVAEPFLLIGILISVCVACGEPRSAGQNPQESLEQPEFLTPVAEAQQAGVTVYWLGEEFGAGPLSFRINGVTEELTGLTDETSGVDISYSARLEEGTTRVEIETHISPSPSIEQVRAQALGVRGAESHPVRVGMWRGEAYVLPGGARPVNALWLFVEVDEETVVVIQGEAGSTGVPGTDVSPTIQEDLLIEVVEEHLRPYPE